MNYTRRTTRPDGMHYRETRKHVGASRGGRRGWRRGLGPAIFLIGVAVVAVLAFLLFHR
jgi:hypothetical protein